MTGLLVLDALTPTFKDMVPPVSYFKEIDLWSMFFIINIVSIILSHIVIDVLIKSHSGFQNKSKPSCCKNIFKNYGLVANNIAKIFFPVATVGFVASYVYKYIKCLRNCIFTIIKGKKSESFFEFFR